MKTPLNWNFVTLKNLIKESKEVNSGGKALPVYTVSKKYGFIPSKTFFEKIVYSKDVSKYKVVRPNFFAYNPHRINVGSIAINFGEMGLVSPAYCVFQIDEKKMLPQFLFYLLKSKKYRNLIKRHSDQGGIRFDLSFSSLSNFSVPLPPIQEQCKLVEIISTVESSVDTINTIIQKSKRLRKGLMQKLLTRGLGNGECEKTKIGQIPKNWQVSKLGDVVTLKSGGTPKRKQSAYWNGNIPWVKSGELNDGLIISTDEKITSRGLKESSAKIFPKGTLLFALFGKGTVSKTGILGINAATNQAVGAIIPKNEMIDPKFLQYYLIFSRRKILTQFVNPSTDVGRTNIYFNTLKLFKIPIPPLPEQQNIVNALSIVDQKLLLQRKNKEKMNRIKKGLINDLLAAKKNIEVAM